MCIILFALLICVLGLPNNPTHLCAAYAPRWVSVGPFCSFYPGAILIDQIYIRPSWMFLVGILFLERTLLAFFINNLFKKQFLNVFLPFFLCRANWRSHCSRLLHFPAFLRHRIHFCRFRRRSCTHTSLDVYSSPKNASTWVLSSLKNYSNVCVRARCSMRSSRRVVIAHQHCLCSLSNVLSLNF